MVRAAQPAGYIERPITPELISAGRSVPIVLSSLVGISRLCFSGMDFKVSSLEEGDDTKTDLAMEVKTRIEKMDSKLGRVGKARNVGTIGLVRAAALDGWSYRQAVFEYATQRNDNWLDFSEIQLLPGLSFTSAPMTGGDSLYPDKILPGIVYDSKDDLTRFFQAQGSGLPKEIPSDNILYIEDAAVPTDVSLLKALVPSIETWREIRRFGILAERRVAVPNEVAQIDGKEIAALVAANVPVDLQKLIDHAEAIVASQGYDNQKISIAGMKLQYPNISMPLDPWQADEYLKKEIVDFFFHRDVLEVTAQAISATNAPSKDLLDLHISSERELWGRPFEKLWNQWLEWNGLELRVELDWWSWTSEDQKAAHQKNLENWRSHSITVNEFRALEGLPPLSDEEIEALAAQHKLLFGKDNALNPERTTV